MGRASPLPLPRPGNEPLLIGRPDVVLLNRGCLTSSRVGGPLSCVEGMRKSKKSGRRQPPAWKVYRLKSSPAVFVGIVYAEDEESALAAAIEEHNIRQADQKRLIVRAR